MRLNLKAITCVALICATFIVTVPWSVAEKAVSRTRDGSIAYVSGEQRGADTAIYIANPDGSEVKRLPNTANAMFLDMDRSGRLITFVSDSDVAEENEIFVINTDGTNKRRLTNNDSSDNEPRFSFDGKKIVFVSERNGANEIYTMNPDGSQQKRLTFHKSTKSAPCFSPNGKQIAFTSVAHNTDEALDVAILIINSNGTKLRRFGHTKTYGDPVWHPKGHALLSEGTSDFAILPVDGSKPTHLPVQGFSASWSLDGDHIVFNRLTDLIEKDGSYTAYYNIFTMSANGQNIKPLVSNRRRDNTIFATRWPSWGGKINQ